MRATESGIAAAVLCLVGLATGCHKDPDRGASAPVADPVSATPATERGGNTGGRPGKLREQSPEVTPVEPGRLNSPELPALPPGGYYRILVLLDDGKITESTYVAANTTGYGLFAASSPKTVKDERMLSVLPPTTTFRPVFLDGSKTAGAYNGTNKDLVLRPNTGGKPILLEACGCRAAPPELRTVADGQAVTVAEDYTRDGKDMLTLYFPNGQKTLAFAIVAMAPAGPKLTVSDATVVEAAEGAVNAVFPVHLSEAAGSDATVRYATVRGTAADGIDFTPTSGTLTFRPGETSKTVSVRVQPNAGREAKDFFLTLSAATNAVIVEGVGLATLRK